MKHACIIGVALRTLTLWKVMLALICTGFLPASTLQVIKILEPITEELNEARCLASPELTNSIHFLFPGLSGIKG